MRALLPHTDGYAINPLDRIRVFYEVFGPVGALRTLVLLPTWSLLHSRIWKAQVPYFARHGFRVVTFDPRGNGRSDRPATGYRTDDFALDTLAVMDAIGVDAAALVAISAGARWGLQVAAEHPDRVTHLALIGAGAWLSGAPRTDLTAFHTEPADTSGWHKYNAYYWRSNFVEFVEFFCAQITNEAHSTRQIEDMVSWGLETTPETLIATIDESPTPRTAEFAAAVRCPVLLVHGTHDTVIPPSNSHDLHEAIPHSVLTMLEGAGHGVIGRAPVRVNLLLHEFLGPSRVDDAPRRHGASRRSKRALFVSSPIGLGHAQRDVAIADELRRLVPNLEIEWLAQDPVTRVLEARGERLHPLSATLASESAHIESECGEHDLHAFQAVRRMDEILLANFLVFHDAVKDAGYDLWVADEGWDVDHYLHENPELKTAPYVWLTDFVGCLPMQPDEEWLTADYNAQMIEHVARRPRVRDLALFVGNPCDVVPHRFGADLPQICDWVEENYAFPGYIQHFDVDRYADRAALRGRLGYATDERVVLATVGGTAVGRSLLTRIMECFAEVHQLQREARLVIVAGPRIDPESLPHMPGVAVFGYMPDLHEHLMACDLAVVQGGLTTTMELVCAQRPFLYFPLHRHFEQAIHVPHRLANYGVRDDARLNFAATTSAGLVEQILAGLCRSTAYKAVEGDGANAAARRIAELL
jgi:pimeloyl-ACP methyl ester carboxylesterase/predicted glycosyltransferase